MEINLRHCKKCKKPRQRIEAGKYPNGKNKKWKDELGKEWNGNICGTCNNARTKETMKKVRHDLKNSPSS